jgi:hypothetical protein
VLCQRLAANASLAPLPLQCEGSGASFVTGFSNAERVSAFYADTFYPLGQAECCTPAVLLSTGDLWELTRWVGGVGWGQGSWAGQRGCLQGLLAAARRCLLLLQLAQQQQMRGS